MNKISKILSERRISLGYSTSKVSEILRIPKKFIVAIENWDVNNLPKSVYLGGFIKNYAKFLDLDAAELYQMYKDGDYLIDDSTESSNYQLINDKEDLPSLSLVIIALLLSFSVYHYWIKMEYQNNQNQLTHMVAESDYNQTQPNFIDYQNYIK